MVGSSYGIDIEIMVQVIISCPKRWSCAVERCSGISVKLWRFVNHVELLKPESGESG